MEIKRVELVRNVCVDSVVGGQWTSHQYGVNRIYGDDRGVHITWNQGSTFTPWANVIYALEERHPGYLRD